MASYTPGSRLPSFGISSSPFERKHLDNEQHPYEYMATDASSSSLSSSMKLERAFSVSPATSSPESLRCKRNKYSPYGSNGNPPVAARRNERERNRVKLVNMGFSTLRNHVPNGAKNKKMSKVETLRSAVDYIKELQALLGESSENLRHGTDNLESSSPLSSISSVAGSSLDPYQLPHHMSSSSPSGHETSSPVSSTTHSPSFETSEVSFQDRERSCSIISSSSNLQQEANHHASFSTSDEDIIAFSKWFS